MGAGLRKGLGRIKQPLRSNNFVPVKSCAVHHGTSAARPIRLSLPCPVPETAVNMPARIALAAKSDEIAVCDG
jgi:hypothetical protein